MFSFNMMMLAKVWICWHSSSVFICLSHPHTPPKWWAWVHSMYWLSYEH